MRRSGRNRVQPAWLSDPLISQNEEDLLQAEETPRRATHPLQGAAGAGPRAAAGGGGGVGGAHGRGLAQRSLQTPRQNAAQIFVSEGSVQLSAATAAVPSPSSAPPSPLLGESPLFRTPPSSPTAASVLSTSPASSRDCSRVLGPPTSPRLSEAGPAFSPLSPRLSEAGPAFQKKNLPSSSSVVPLPAAAPRLAPASPPAAASPSAADSPPAAASPSSATSPPTGDSMQPGAAAQLLPPAPPQPEADRHAPDADLDPLTQQSQLPAEDAPGLPDLETIFRTRKPTLT